MNNIDFAINLKKIFPKIPDDFFAQINRYKLFLQKYNQKTNLTRLADENKIYSEYFYESIVPYKDFDFVKIQSLLDIGSGSGIPGIVLKLLYPYIQLTIIESNNKKVTFLKELCYHLKIKATVLNQRAENIQNKQREQFDIVTCRAVASLPIIVELSLPYLKVNGLLIAPKSQKWIDEMSASKNIIPAVGGKALPTYQFTSINHKFHAVIFIQKSKKTNHYYPRSWNLIVKDGK